MHVTVTDRREISCVVCLGLNLKLVARWQRGAHDECDGNGSHASYEYMEHMEKRKDLNGTQNDNKFLLRLMDYNLTRHTQFQTSPQR